MAEMAPKGRGRPRKHGLREPEVLRRALLAVVFYQQARTAGEKYSVAVREAAAHVRSRNPHTRMSETEVKRILAEFWPKNAESVILAEESAVEEAEVMRLRDLLAQVPSSDRKVESFIVHYRPLRKLAIRFGKRPNYPRHNAP